LGARSLLCQVAERRQPHPDPRKSDPAPKLLASLGARAHERPPSAPDAPAASRPAPAAATRGGTLTISVSSHWRATTARAQARRTATSSVPLTKSKLGRPGSRLVEWMAGSA